MKRRAGLTLPSLVTVSLLAPRDSTMPPCSPKKVSTGGLGRLPSRPSVMLATRGCGAPFQDGSAHTLAHSDFMCGLHEREDRHWHHTVVCVRGRTEVDITPCSPCSLIPRKAQGLGPEIQTLSRLPSSPASCLPPGAVGRLSHWIGDHQACCQAVGVSGNVGSAVLEDAQPTWGPGIQLHAQRTDTGKSQALELSPRAPVMQLQTATVLV